MAYCITDMLYETRYIIPRCGRKKEVLIPDTQ